MLLGPEMRSTGEVIGLDRSFGVAFAKSQLGAGTQVPRTGTVFVSVRDVGQGPHPAGGEDSCRSSASRSWRPAARSASSRITASLPQGSTRCWKAVLTSSDAIKNGDIQLVFNTTEGAGALSDSRSLRRAALLHKVPYYTTLAGAMAAAEGIEAYLGGDLEVRALQDYFA